MKRVPIYARSAPIACAANASFPRLILPDKIITPSISSGITFSPVLSEVLRPLAWFGLFIKLVVKCFKADFIEINKNIYNFNNKKIFFLDNLSIQQLELTISKCSTLVSCHGSATHIASAFNKRIIDIIDISEKLFFDKWSAHFRNYTQLQRLEFNKLSDLILNKLQNN